MVNGNQLSLFPLWLYKGSLGVPAVLRRLWVVPDCPDHLKDTGGQVVYMQPRLWYRGDNDGP